MRIFMTLLAIYFFVTVVPAAADVLPVGATVDFDRVTASNPNLGAWDRGTITGTTKIAGQSYYKIRNQAGTPYTIPNDPRWIRAVNPASPGPAPDGTHTGPYPGDTGSPRAGAPRTTRAPGAAGRFPVGTRVEFDRVEAQNPANGRWDEGVIVGRTPGGYIQIRGKNGTLYRIADDPRWILPAGSPLPGRRHDYLDHPTSASKAGKHSTSSPSGSGGSAGPLTGEWAVISVDGERRSGFGMTFHFVGSRYELIHYSGEIAAGHFTVSGSTVRMVQEDGTSYGTFHYSIQGNRLVLRGSGTEFICERAHR